MKVTNFMTVNRLLVGFIVVVFVQACSSSGSSSNDCEADDDSARFALLANSTTTLTMNGTIDCTTDGKLQKALSENPIDTILMQVVEGSVDDESNIAMSRKLAGQSIHIEVAEDGLIASGGVDFFLAGATRKINNNSLVGVHSWADSDGNEGIDVYNSNPDPTNAEHSMFVEYYSQFVSGLKDGRPGNSVTDVAVDFYVYTLDSAPAAGLHCMTAQELVNWGVVTDTTNVADLNPVIKGSSHLFASACTH